ncbi:Uncharacterized protein At2g02148 [Linum perenne]
MSADEMGSRVPVQHYDLRSPPTANSFIGSSLHDLNTVDSRPHPAIERIDEVDRHHPDSSDTGLNAEDDPHGASVDCMHESYRDSLQIHGVGVEDDRSSIENSGSSRVAYNLLNIEDVSPIESARARFLQIIVDYFICDHVIEVMDSDGDYSGQPGQDSLSKRKPGEVRYEGDPRFALPLMYVANMYETLVNDVNLRLVSMNGIRDKTIGVALEAAGGLYRRMAKKFPKRGSCMFKRRELATSVETRTRFPELVIQEEKRVRFVVVNGLDIVEKPTNLPIEDAECLYPVPELVVHLKRFRRLTGRSEVAVSPQDYKYYSPRHKYRRIMTNIPGLSTIPGTDGSATMVADQGFRSPQSQEQTPPKHHNVPHLTHQPQFHPVVHQVHHQSQHSTPQFHPPLVHMPEMSHSNQSPNISPHMAYLQPLAGNHLGGRLHILPSSPAKFCDECGAPYLRETSKFCSECGTKRLGT